MSAAAQELSFLGVKAIVGVNLVSYATRRWAGMEARRAEDDVTKTLLVRGKKSRCVSPFWVCIRLLVYSDRSNHELKALLNAKVDDAAPTSEIGERRRQNAKKNGGNGGGKKERVKLEDLTRFTMVKRIW